MKVEFEFEPPDGIEVSAFEGVAICNAFSSDGGQIILYGHLGEPSDFTQIGLFTVGLRYAESVFDSEDES